MNAEGDDVVAAPYGYAERRCVNPGATVGAERGRVFPFGALPALTCKNLGTVATFPGFLVSPIRTANGLPASACASSQRSWFGAALRGRVLKYQYVVRKNQETFRLPGQGLRPAKAHENGLEWQNIAGE